MNKQTEIERSKRPMMNEQTEIDLTELRSSRDDLESCAVHAFSMGYRATSAGSRLSALVPPISALERLIGHGREYRTDRTSSIDLLIRTHAEKSCLASVKDGSASRSAFPSASRIRHLQKLCSEWTRSVNP
jgi:hypothetical protein